MSKLNQVLLRKKAFKCRVLILLVLLFAISIFFSCDNFWDWIPRQPLAFADLSGAKALAIVASSDGSRGINTDSTYDELYKQLSDGSWVSVDYENTSGMAMNYAMDLLSLRRLDHQFFVLIFGYRELNLDLEPVGVWTDTFILDSSTGNMYYLNQISNVFGGWTDSTTSPLQRLFSSDGSGRIYFISATQSINNFSNQASEVRETSDIVRLSLDYNTSELTAEFLTPEATWEYDIYANNQGDLIYSFAETLGGTKRLAFQSSGGEYGFVSDYIDISDISQLYNGDNHEIYWASSDSGTCVLNQIAFNNEVPGISNTFTLDGLDSIENAVIEDEYILFFGSSSICKFFYSGDVISIDYPVAITLGQIIIKSDRYIYILDEEQAATFAILVDLDSQNAIEYPFNGARYSVNEFRDYPSDSDAVFASLTDVLKGDTSSYKLHPDGTMELLSVEQEESLILKIEPL